VEKSSTIVLNGLWAKVAQGILVAAVLAGASGLLIAVRMDDRQEAHRLALADHELRMRALEGRLADLSNGISTLLERTTPKGGS